jgi:hypothetical protein
MNPELIELCPICIENEALYFTECGHGYCVCCLSRIKKCAMCRKSLLRSMLCVEIKHKVNPIQDSNFDRYIRPNDSNRLNFNHPVRELIWALNPEPVLRIMMSGMGGLAYSN